MGRIQDEIEDEYHAKELAEKAVRYKETQTDLRLVLSNIRKITDDYSVSSSLSNAADSFEKELLFWEKQNAIYLEK